jgi:GxxExxY protein
MNTDKGADKTLWLKNRPDVVDAAYPESELTGRILEAAFDVHNALGCGFLERVYSNALAIELRRSGLDCAQESPLKIRYRDTIVGDYLADIIVDGRVIIELKACSSLDPSHSAQVLNYLRAANVRVGLLLNFGRPKLEYRRFIY